jgi:hypothetical protein
MLTAAPYVVLVEDTASVVVVVVNAELITIACEADVLVP